MKESQLAPCPLCGSDHISTLAMQSFTTGCRDCYQVKVQCFNSPEESEAAWNKLFNNQSALQESKLIKGEKC